MHINAANLEIKNLKNEQEQIEEVGKGLGNELIKVGALIEEHKKKINEIDDKRKELNVNRQTTELNKTKCQKEINELKDKKEQLLKTQTNNIEEYKEMILKIEKEIESLDKNLPQDEYKKKY